MDEQHSLCAHYKYESSTVRFLKFRLYSNNDAAQDILDTQDPIKDASISNVMATHENVICCNFVVQV